MDIRAFGLSFIQEAKQSYKRSSKDINEIPSKIVGRISMRALNQLKELPNEKPSILLKILVITPKVLNYHPHLIISKSLLAAGRILAKGAKGVIDPGKETSAGESHPHAGMEQWLNPNPKKLGPNENFDVNEGLNQIKQSLNEDNIETYIKAVSDGNKVMEQATKEFIGGLNAYLNEKLSPDEKRVIYLCKSNSITQQEKNLVYGRCVALRDQYLQGA